MSRHGAPVVASLGAVLALVSLLAQGEAQAQAACRALESTLAQSTCLTDRALGDTDPEACLAGTQPAATYNCLATYAAVTGDPAACSLVPRGGTVSRAALEGDCLTRAARARGDATLCAGIAAGDARDACHLFLADQTGNRSLCAEIANAALRGDCTEG